jgi:hypothetical protein
MRPAAAPMRKFHSPFAYSFDGDSIVQEANGSKLTTFDPTGRRNNH